MAALSQRKSLFRQVANISIGIRKENAGIQASSILHLPEVNRKKQHAKIDNKSWRILDTAWDAITHFNDSKKINIATAKVIELKLHLSVPGRPEKNLPQKNP